MTTKPQFVRQLPDDPTPVDSLHMNLTIASDEQPDRNAPARRSVVPAPIGSAIRQLLSRYEMSTGLDIPAVIAVTAALRGEGVTSAASALAAVLAADFDAHVCYVDLSWATEGRPSTSSHSVVPGVCELLRGTAALDVVMVSDPDHPGVDRIGPGETPPDDRSRLARSTQVAGMMHDLTTRLDFVVLDTPPVLGNADALTLIRHADAQIMIVRHGATSITQVRTAADELRSIPSMGAILNQYRSRTPAFIRNRLDG